MWISTAIVTVMESLPVRGAWIEIRFAPPNDEIARSLPVRGAWIEIVICQLQSSQPRVAPRAGSVD